MKKAAYKLLLSGLAFFGSSKEMLAATECDVAQGIILPALQPHQECGLNTFIMGDFIYWTARQDGLAYAVSGWGLGEPSKGKVEQADFDFDPGFKVGLGHLFGHDDWELIAEYTMLRTTDHTHKVHVEHLDDSTIRPLWYDEAASPALLPQSPALSEAEGKWQLKFNVIDLNLGRRFLVSRYLSLRPFFGLKGTWQRQDYDVRYQRDETVNSIPLWKILSNQKYWGIGICSGLNAGWYFTRYWSLYGDFSLAALWSDFHVTRKDSQENSAIEDSVGSVLLDMENRFHALKPTLQLSFGLRWNTSFRNDSYHFLVQAGWEEQVWWSQNQLYTTYEEAAHGDLILQGLTMKVRFDF